MKSLILLFTALTLSIAFYAQSGCTDPAACNYNSEAIEDDGSCCFGACIQVELADVLGASDLEWSLLDDMGNIISSGNSPSTGLLCLEPGCYTFSLTDLNGDDPNVANLYIVDEEGNVLIDLTWDFNLPSGVDLAFCVPEECATADLNCDFSVSVGDLLYLISQIGCEGECDADLNEDGEVDIADLLFMITQLG